MQELNTDFSKICITPKPFGPLWARFPYQFLRNWNTKLGKIYPLLTTLLPLPRLHLLAVSLLRSANKKVKSQIQKGANPEKAAKRGYQEACEYLDLWNKTILIQHSSHMP